VGAFLFLATATIVVWQNSRLAVLWDLSYILENANRMSWGDVPYRDFPFPYPPLTFLIQAAVIKLGGRVFWHTIVYSAIVGGAATVVTWRIVLHLLRERVAHARAIAFILTIPLIVLGIYCVFPHPFYDPDCAFAILLAIFLLQRADRKESSTAASVLAGITLILPLFVKQNIGLAFLLTTIGGVTLVAIVEKIRGKAIRRYVLIVSSAAAALGIALLLIHVTAGLKNYWHWTIQFAAERRTPARAEMIEIYKSKAVLWSTLLFAIGCALSWFARKRSLGWLSVVAGVVLASPFTWPAIYLLLDRDSSERADRLLNVWPLVLIVSLVLTIITMRRRPGLDLVLPFVLIATINGTFMSQQLWGSTYAIWPLLMILLAYPAHALYQFAGSRPAVFFAAIVSAGLLIAGSAYVYSHERLDYANLDEGALTKSNLPALKGMRTRGDWLPNFEELVRYTDANIPRLAPVLIIPGEDLFYYTTGRRPQFPVLLFDHTVNPYAPAEIVKLARDRNINWLIVKQDLQDEDENLEQQRDALTEALEQEFEQVESLQGYDIYKRSQPDDDKSPVEK
jgi:4-amino-4-deoxy-L-arabinose transferase-like glycosyltransferase